MCVAYENMAEMTSVIYTVYRVGTVVGASMAGAIWTQILYRYEIRSFRLGLYLFMQPYDFVEKCGWETKVRMPFKSTRKCRKF